MNTITVEGTEIEIQATDEHFHPYPVALMGGEPVGGFLGCWGKGEPFLSMKDVLNFPQPIALTPEQQSVVMDVYKNQTLPAIAAHAKRHPYVPSREEVREWNDDQNRAY